MKNVRNREQQASRLLPGASSILTTDESNAMKGLDKHVNSSMILSTKKDESTLLV